VTGIVAAFALTAGMVAQATGGRLAAGLAEQAFGSVSIDSRTLQEGALFFAIKGERFDGQAFVPEALARGAGGLVVAAPVDAPRDAAVIVVADTTTALQHLGHVVRRRSGATVVAITGSAGKTTTKEIAARLIAARHPVVRNAGNLNNHIGLPLSLLELRHGARVAVMELGMNHAGEIRTLVGIAEPEVRVWLNVGDAHLGHFGSREAIAAAKAEILDQASPDTVVIANADDPLVMRHAAGSAGRLVTFGEDPRAAVRATRIDSRGFEGTSAAVETPAGALDLAIPLAGRGHVMNVLAAIAVALELDVPLGVIPPAIAALAPVARRGTATALANGASLVDDSYNASPSAVQSMLDALGATPVAGRRIAVLGEMLELGEAAYALHEACGRAAAASRVDELVAIGGPAAGGYADGAVAAGMPRQRVHRFVDSASAADAVAALVRSGDLVLVKGSRGTRTDIVADRLLGGRGEARA
jgi:UDP-N-acetylmuramoyl-tripeptide--D-alanyl-D-alanine ligase